MSTVQFFLVALPVLIIAILAFAQTRKQPATEPPGRVLMFFVWGAAYSMLVAMIGMIGSILVFALFGAIPGTASAGGIRNGQYCFNWHDTTFTAVSKSTWYTAWFLEQLTQHLLWISLGVLVTCVAAGLAAGLLRGAGAVDRYKPDA